MLSTITTITNKTAIPGFRFLIRSFKRQQGGSIRRQYISTAFHSSRSVSTTTAATTTSSNSNNNPQNQKQQEEDLQYAIQLVKKHDPAGYLPGLLMPTTKMKTSYFAIRSFWISTGLYKQSTAQVPINATPLEHLEWWQQVIDQELFGTPRTPSTTTVNDNTINNIIGHPTVRLLYQLIHPTNDNVMNTMDADAVLAKQHFDDILQGRRNDSDLKQYPTLKHLEQHALLSCGSLFQLVLESGGMTEHGAAKNPVAHQAAKLVGIGHGLANALRTSIPIMSTTGKLIIPEDLCIKHGVKSPRYLLSALGQGDTDAKKELALAVRDIATTAQQHFNRARTLRDAILMEEHGEQAAPVLLPALASETFLNRLEKSGYDLTDRDLRNVGFWEHWHCALRMMWAYTQKMY